LKVETCHFVEVMVVYFYLFALHICTCIH